MSRPDLAALMVEGHGVHVEIRNPEGSRAPVLCLHSTGMSGRQWRRLAKSLAAAGHPVWLPDLLGYGASAPWRGPSRFDTNMDLAIVTALVERVGGPYHLVGHSYGGRLALAHLAANPANVRSLCAYEPVAYGVLRSSGDAVGLRELEDYDHDGRFLDETFGGSVAWLERFVDYWSGAGTWASMPPEAKEGFLRSRRKVFEEVKDTCADATRHEDFIPLSTPMLVMSGAESRLSARRVCAVLGEQCPNVQHIELADGIHMAPLVAPFDVNDPFMAHIAAAEQRATNG